MSAENMKTIRGDVLPWPNGGECRVAVVDGDTEYGVVPRGAGADLIEHLSDPVEVEGVVTEDEEGVLRIVVRRYRVVENFDDDALYED